MAWPAPAGPGPGRAPPGERRKGRGKSDVSSNRIKTVVIVPGVTEPATIGPHDVPPHAGQVVRRVLLRRNIVIDAETAQLVAAAVQAAPQAGEAALAVRRRAGG